MFRIIIGRLVLKTEQGKSFNQQIYIDSDTRQVEFGVNGGNGGIKSVQFYPALVPCVVKFFKLQTLDENGGATTRRVARSNESKRIGDVLFFRTLEPYVECDVHGEKLSRVIIELKYYAVDEVAIRALEILTNEVQKDVVAPVVRVRPSRASTTRLFFIRMVQQRFWLFRQFATIAIRRPGAVLKNLNMKNVRTLRFAIAGEVPTQVVSNLNSLLDHEETPAEIPQAAQMHTAEQIIVAPHDPARTEEGSTPVDKKEELPDFAGSSEDRMSSEIKTIWADQKKDLYEEFKVAGYYDSEDSGLELIEQLRSNSERHPELYKEYKENPPILNFKSKAIAFYLPQYHQIPENDQWWGKGFTEWTNVTKAIPRFKGHIQPKLPGELGFYDLSNLGTLIRQVELARNYGIYGFCFHHYWFSGVRLLEKPVDLFLESDIDFPFCLCWANENWSRRWDGTERDLLMKQHYLDSDPVRFVEDIAPYVRDPRYITISGRPVLIIYRAKEIPRILQVVETWRTEFVKHGLGEPLLVSAQTFGMLDPNEVGCDVAVEFPPHELAQHPNFINDVLRIFNPDYMGWVRNYKDAVAWAEGIKERNFPLFKTVFPGWDNEARKTNKGFVWAFSTPDLYGRWLDSSFEYARDYPVYDEQIVFINAWNEWAEGAYLEPDRHYGYAYLDKTYEILAKYNNE